MTRNARVHSISIHCCLSGSGMHHCRLLCAPTAQESYLCSHLYSFQGVHHLQVSSAQVLVVEALKVLRYKWDIDWPFCAMDRVAP